MFNYPTPARPSHASLCSLRDARNHRRHPPRRNPSSTPPLSSHVELSSPPAAVLAEDTSYDPAAALDLDYPTTTAPVRAHTHGCGSKSLSSTLLDNRRPLVHRATASISSLQQQSRSSLPSPSAVSLPPSTLPAITINHGHGHCQLQTHPSPANDNTSRNSIFGNWFSGNSAPCHIGFVPNERHPESDSESDIGSDSEADDDDDDDDDNSCDGMDPVSSYTRAPPALGQRRREKRESTSPSGAPQPAPAPSKLSSWFGRSNTPAHHRKLSSSQPQDPLLTLNVEHALFPHGPSDPLDPASYNDLLANATALLNQYQASYKVLYFAMSDARLDADAAREETAEAETRVRQLRNQLEEKQRQAQRHDDDMHALMAALNAEKLARQQDELAAARARAVRSAGRASGGSNARVPSISKRKSAASLGGASMHSDSGFESEGETAVDGASVRDSVLSDAEVLEGQIRELCEPSTPTRLEGVDADGREETEAEEEEEVTPRASVTTAAAATRGGRNGNGNGGAGGERDPKPGMLKRMSTFDLVMQKKRGAQDGKKMGSGSTSSSNVPKTIGGARASNVCEVQQGQMEVWNENRVLRERVGELEKAVEESLGLVRCLGL